MGRTQLPKGTNKTITVRGRAADIKVIKDAAKIKKQSFASFLLGAALSRAKRIVKLGK